MSFITSPAFLSAVLAGSSHCRCLGGGWSGIPKGIELPVILLEKLVLQGKGRICTEKKSFVMVFFLVQVPTLCLRMQN